MIWSIIVWSIFGFLAGIVAKYIMPGKDPGGILVTIIIGILGSIVGGFIGNLIGFNDGATTSDSLVSVLTNWKLWITSVVGALIILYIWKSFLAPMLNK